MPNFFYSLSATIVDGTGSLTAMLTDSVMQKITGTSCKDFIFVDGYDDRKIIPNPIQKHKTETHTFIVEMTKKSNPEKINFVITNAAKTGLQISPQHLDTQNESQHTPHPLQIRTPAQLPAPSSEFAPSPIQIQTPAQQQPAAQKSVTPTTPLPASQPDTPNTLTMQSIAADPATDFEKNIPTALETSTKEAHETTARRLHFDIPDDVNPTKRARYED